jgi:very-short-patch-repair endonuclease
MLVVILTDKFRLRIMNYPVIKIPFLIANTKPQRVQVEYIEEVQNQTKIKQSQFSSLLNIISYGLLLLGVIIFGFGVVGHIQWIPLSLVNFLLGLAGINWTKYQQIALNITPLETKSTRSIIKTETIAVDWDNILTGKVMIKGNRATAQEGVSESHFYKYLKKYFSYVIYPGYEFKLNENYTYSSDFTLMLSNEISIIIEIDEPYDGATKKPHHCTDNDKDDNRDKFFLDGNWIVIRFSEYQACACPIECCHEIAKMIDRIYPANNHIEQFKDVGNLKKDSRWNYKQALAMAKKNYRLKYLARYNIYHQRG